MQVCGQRVHVHDLQAGSSTRARNTEITYHTNDISPLLITCEAADQLETPAHARSRSQNARRWRRAAAAVARRRARGARKCACLEAPVTPVVVRESAVVLERPPICERVKAGQVARPDALLQLPDTLTGNCLPPLHRFPQARTRPERNQGDSKGYHVSDPRRPLQGVSRLRPSKAARGLRSYPLNLIWVRVEPPPCPRPRDRPPHTEPWSRPMRMRTFADLDV